MKTTFRYLSGIAFSILATLPGIAIANVYPTNLGQSANSFNPSAAESVTLSYLLNEDATDVSIQILDNTSSIVRTLTGPTTKGTQTIVWDGKNDSNVTLPDGNYSFRVTSGGEERTAWTLTSTDSTLNNFFLPRGVAVNKNPDSPYYGRLYVTEGAGPVNTAAGRAVEDGVYMLNTDLTDNGIVGGSGPHKGGVTWVSPSQSSPYKVAVGPDDSVYVTDWADAHSGLWQAPANLSGTWIEALDNTGRAPSGLNATHGSISDVVVTGTGADRKIYTADEDFIPIPDTSSTGSIPRYDIGTQTTFTGAPSGFAYIDGVGGDTTVNRVQNFQNGLAFDNDGNLWISQRRDPTTPGTIASVIQVDPNGTVLWSSIPELAASTPSDPLRGNFGIDFDPGTGLLAVATTLTGDGVQGEVVLFDTVSKTVIDRFYFDPTSATNNTDVAFDAVGNLIVSNRSKERVRVWAPPNTLGYRPLNEFTTDSLGPLGTLTISSVSAGLDGDFNDDGVVDAADYVVWAKFQGSVSGLPNDPNAGTVIDIDQYNTWRANYGSGSPGAGGSVPEPSALLLSAIAAIVGSCCCRRSDRR